RRLSRHGTDIPARVRHQTRGSAPGGRLALSSWPTVGYGYEPARVTFPHAGPGERTLRRAGATNNSATQHVSGISEKRLKLLRTPGHTCPADRLRCGLRCMSHRFIRIGVG